MDQVLRVYDLVGKLLNAIEGIDVHNLACGRVKGNENELFKIDRSERQGCVMYTWFSFVYVNGVMKEVKMEMRFSEERRENEGYWVCCK